MNFRKIPLIIYSLALIYTIVLMIVVNISGNYLNETSSLIYKNIVLGIVLIGAILGLVINIKLRDKRKRNFHFILIGGLIFSILSNLTYYFTFLENILVWIQVIAAIIGYSLIILFIVSLFVPIKNKQ